MNDIRKIVRQTLREFITQRELGSVEQYADNLFSNIGVDVEFTKHFFDRVNDIRNGEEITPEELRDLYLKAYKKYNEMIPNLKPGEERVFTDRSTNINVPFVMNWDGRSPELDMVNKTIMRKRDFKSISPKLQLEDINENIDVPINVGDEVLGGKFKNKKITVKDISKNDKGDITINNKPLLRVRTLQEDENKDDKIGKILWFEYHCFESETSCDANLWYHSHQQVLVLSIAELGGGNTPEERGESGEPRVYKVKFSDGFEWDVFEDELVDSPEDFYRPDPPKK